MSDDDDITRSTEDEINALAWARRVGPLDPEGGKGPDCEAVESPQPDPGTDTPRRRTKLRIGGHVSEGMSANPDPRVIEASNRVGVYLSELDELDSLGWGVRALVDPAGAPGGGAAITMEFTEPRFGSGQRLTLWSLPDGSHARAEVDLAVAALLGEALKRGIEFGFNTPIGAEHPILLVFYAAWRDHYEGNLPALFPFKRNGGMVS